MLSIASTECVYPFISGAHHIELFLSNGIDDDRVETVCLLSFRRWNNRSVIRYTHTTLYAQARSRFFPLKTKRNVNVAFFAGRSAVFSYLSLCLIDFCCGYAAIFIPVTWLCQRVHIYIFLMHQRKEPVECARLDQE